MATYTNWNKEGTRGRQAERREARMAHTVSACVWRDTTTLHLYRDGKKGGDDETMAIDLSPEETENLRVALNARAATREQEEERRAMVENAAAEFPKQFAIKGIPGALFYIFQGDCKVKDGEVFLTIHTMSNGVKLCDMTPEQLREAIEATVEV